MSAAEKKLAPADEYFGPLKMSVLGIRNQIHDLMIRYEPTWDTDKHLAKAIMGTAVMTEASLHDWEQKYPSDNQLARSVYLLQHLYAKIQLDQSQEKAKFVAQWLVTRYGNTWYGKNMKTFLNQATPAPSATPTGGESTSSPSSEPGTPSPSSAPNGANGSKASAPSGSPSKPTATSEPTAASTPAPASSKP